MDLPELLGSKSLKSKEKAGEISCWLLENRQAPGLLLAFAKKTKGPQKATCIEAMEQATLKNPALASPEWFDFVTEQLMDKAPRVKWESAKVIAHTVHLFPKKLDKTIVHLLENTEHTGTVVRWSAAFALANIVQLKTPYNKDLVPALRSILEREEKNSIKKIYAEALKNWPGKT